MDAIREFLGTLARMHTDGECRCEPACGETDCETAFVMENDDAVTVVNETIERARELLAAEPPTGNSFPVLLTTKEGDHTQLVVVSHPTLDAKAFEEAFLIADLRASQNVEDSSLDEDVFPILAADGWSITPGNPVEVYY